MLDQQYFDEMAKATISRWSPRPQALFDPCLRFRAANAAYEEATSTPRRDLLHTRVDEVFPDNPDNDGRRGAQRAVETIEHVLRTGEPTDLGTLRYDIAAPNNPEIFLPHIWVVQMRPVVVGGKVEAVHAVVDDATPVRQVASELAQAITGVDGVDSGRHRALLHQLNALFKRYPGPVECAAATDPQLRRVLHSRDVIEQAVGNLVRRHHVCSAADAYAVLARRAREANTTLSAAAELFIVAS